MDNVAHVERVVLLIHGIRTQADWQPMLVRLFEENVKVIPIKYGYFDVFRFWLPGITRRAPIKRVERELRDARTKYPHAKISIIAHSFGSYIVGELLKGASDLKLDRLILCGSILLDSYPWEDVMDKFIDGNSEYVTNVINECGKKDIWPVLAQSTSWGYGASGTHGFGQIEVIDRFHNAKHDDCLTRDFATTYWKPFIENGECKRTEFESNMPATPWLLSMLGWLPLRWIIVLAIPLSLFFGGVMSSEPTEPTPSYPFPEKLYVHFKQNGGLEYLRDELMKHFRDEGGTKVRDHQNVEESHFPKSSSVRFFYDSDLKSAEGIRQQTVDFFHKKNCPIYDLAVKNLKVENAQEGAVELWIDHNCTQGQAK